MLGVCVSDLGAMPPFLPTLLTSVPEICHTLPSTLVSELLAIYNFCPLQRKTKAIETNIASQCCSVSPEGVHMFQSVFRHFL